MKNMNLQRFYWIVGSLLFIVISAACALPFAGAAIPAAVTNETPTALFKPTPTTVSPTRITAHDWSGYQIKGELVHLCGSHVAGAGRDLPGKQCQGRHLGRFRRLHRRQQRSHYRVGRHGCHLQRHDRQLQRLVGNVCRSSGQQERYLFHGLSGRYRFLIGLRYQRDVCNAGDQ